MSLRSPRALARAGLVAPEDADALNAVAARYAVAITPAMAELIDPHDPDDPVGRQFIPSAAELVHKPQERADPIGDAAHTPVEGIVHRYPDRVLLTLTHVCAVYCRFCFRREVVGPDGAARLAGEKLDAALAYIAERPAIWEAILTGGDPLLLSPRRLREVAERLRDIEHVKVLRVHTRIPVVAPETVTAERIAALKAFGRAVYVVLHANHVRELTPAARKACAGLIDAGVPMLSQSVLLRGVNDTPAALEALMRALVETRIKPYYLHHSDLALGTSHFRTTLTHGQALMRDLRGRVSGLCQPSYVLDIPGGHGKAPVGPCHLHGEEGDWRVEAPNGGLHPYLPA